MGRSLDPIGGQLPLSHNPLMRIGYENNRPKLKISDLIKQWQEGWQTFGLAALKEITGLDLSSPIAFIASLGGLLRNAIGKMFNGVIPASWIADVIHDLTEGAGGFTDPAMVESNPDWHFDPAQNGHLSGKSIYVTANGIEHAISLKDSFDVAPGQTVDVAASAMWQGVKAVAGSNPIRLCITPFGPTGAKLPDVVVKQVHPVAADSSWVRASLTGSWAVPSNGSVKAATVTLVVTAGATAGTVHYSNVTTVMSNLGPVLGAFRSFFDAIGGEVNSGISQFEQRFAAITADGKITASEILGLLGLGNIPKLPPAKVESPIGSPDIGHDLRDTWDHFWNAVFGGNATGKTPADMGAATAALKQTADDASEAAKYVTAMITTPRLSPRWVSTGNHDDVSFPIALVPAVNGTYTPPLGKLVLMPITGEITRMYKSVKFGMTTSATMGACHVGVYRPDTSGVPQLEVNLGNVKPLMQNAKVQVFSLPGDGVQVTKGETLFVGVLQLGGTAAPMLTSPAMQTVLEAVQTIPLYFSQDGGSSLTVLPATVTSNIELVPVWGALGEELPPNPWVDFPFVPDATRGTVYNIPTDSRYLHLVGCTPGGGGGGGDGGWGLPGEGGRPGAWVGRRLERGVDIPWSVTTLFVGNDGATGFMGPGKGAAGKEADGWAGGGFNYREVTTDWPLVSYLPGDGTEVRLLVGRPGNGGRLAYGNFYRWDAVGYGPGNFAFGGRLFLGGASTATPPNVGAGRGYDGASPGGGGSGGSGGSGGNAGGGGNGGAGFVAIKATA